jgi:hypothetical protein
VVAGVEGRELVVECLDPIFEPGESAAYRVALAVSVAALCAVANAMRASPVRCSASAMND